MDRSAIAEALPSYELAEPLGRGAMGEVLGARHRDLERAVAIKGLPDGFAADADVRRRFGAEARVLASLSHPHVVPVYDYVERDGLCLLVMEALPGGTLWDRFCGEGVSMPVAVAVVLAACAGLQHAHERQVIHRDVKPENLMFGADKTLKVTDFGIAAMLGDGALATVSGEVIGTPAYMAPEQADGSAVTPRADVYALATVLYELLSGSLPFDESGDAMDLLRRRLEVAPRPLDEVAPHVPVELAAAVMAALARRPEDRPATAEAFGVAVASAATAAWGPTWLDGSDVRLLVGGALAQAVVGPSAATDAPPEAAPPASPAAPASPGAAAPLAGRRARETRAPDGAAKPPAPETMARSAPPDQAPPRRPTRAAERSDGPDLSQLKPADVVPLSSAVSSPKVSWLALVGASVALAVAGLLAVAAPTSPALDPSPVGITVAGEVVGEEPVAVDLSEPIPLQVANPPAGASGAQLRFSVGPVPFGSSNTAALTSTSGGAATELSATSARLYASGPLTAELLLTDGAGREVETRTFSVDPEGSPILTAGGLASILLAVAAVAYGWAASSPLRRGRRRLGAFVSLAVSGAVGGVAAVACAWSFGAGQPTSSGLVAPVVLASVGFVAAGVFALSVGRVRRQRRRRRARPLRRPTTSGAR